MVGSFWEEGGEEEEDKEKLEGGMETRKGGGCYTLKCHLCIGS